MWLYLHLILVLATQLRVLSRDDVGATTRLAWFLVLLAVPLAGVVLYFLFGEANLGKRTTANSKHIAAHISKLAQDDRLPGLKSGANLHARYKAAFTYAMSINGFPVSRATHAELMPNDAEARARLIADIDAAKSSVNLLYYIWLEDTTGTNVAQAVIRAAQRGVTCRVMVDGMGSRAFIKSKLWKDMQDAGIKTSIALPFHNLLKVVLFSRLDLRNHRKITVIDENITHCGSQNCADPEFAVKPRYAPWIDIMVRFEGPIARQNQLLFAGDWMLHDLDFLPKLSEPKQQALSGFPAVVWGDGPTSRRGTAQQMFAVLIGQARESLTISTPYFVPGDIVLDALCACAYRGVEVTLIFPRKNDSFVVAAASHSHYSEMLRAGIKIYEHQKGLLHAKTLTIDGRVAMIGSSNMDLRSFDLNYENNILLYDEKITHDIRSRQEDYIRASQQVTLLDAKNWSLFRRIWNNVIATLGPVL